MIDIWLILCQLVPSAKVVLLTAMEYLRDEEQEKETSAVEDLCRILFCEISSVQCRDRSLRA